jgi:hypothetical protein
MIQFTNEELDHIWHALAQYVENWEEDVTPPAPALSALKKFDERKAGLAADPAVQAFIEARKKELEAEPVRGLRAAEPEPDWRHGLRLLLPEYMHRSVTAWIEEGQPNPNAMGAFLRAVLQNRLVEAFATADTENETAMWMWVRFLRDYAPPDCWGSMEAMSSWFQQKRATRLGASRKGE